MQAGVNAMLNALDAVCSPVDVFLRDDDAGWDDARLLALLDCVDRAGVPIDLAVIPRACGAPLARELHARMDAAPGSVGVHQHGLAHANHESVNRKCEFGGARGIDQQRRDLCDGRTRLRDLFGSRLEAIFTPPWNRCSPGTPDLLAELGYAGLSRDRGAPAQRALPELPVDVDWCRERRLAAQRGEDAGTRIGLALARQILAAQRVGLMLHHADMDAQDLLALSALLAASLCHPRARWISMGELLRARDGKHLRQRDEETI